MTSRFECLPRKIKRITSQIDDNTESRIQNTYNFYRTIIHPSILRLTNVKEKLNYALWLSRLDNEENKERQIHFIKIVFISLKRNQPFHIFLVPPPEDLSELNMDDLNTVETIEYLHNNDTGKSLDDEKTPQRTKFKRFAAVATDMNSYTTVKISKYLAQSFYVMSDFPINVWYNPTNIVTPNSLDHNEWELFLNHFDIVTKGKTEVDPKQLNCEDIMKLEQVSREGANTFIWHPHSVLKDCHRPKRSAGYNEIDVNILNQQLTQQQMDEAAIAVVHKKTLPGYKILNPRIYSTIIMPDPEFVFNTTGVKITYNKTPRNINKNDQKVQDENSACGPLKQQKNENNCGNNNVKTNMKSVCNSSTKQLPCSSIIAQNTNNCQKSCSNTTQAQTQRVEAGNSSDLELNKTYTCNLSHGNGPSFSLKLLSKSLDSENRRMKHKQRNASCHKKQCQNGKHLNQTNNNQSRIENDQCNVSNPHSASLNDSSNYEWTMFSNEMSIDQNTVPIYTSPNRSPYDQSHQTRRMSIENQNDHLSCVRSTNQNSSKNKKYYNDGHHTYHEYEEQRSPQSKKNVSSHLNRSQNKECRNCSNRSNNTSRHRKLRPRSSSLPSYCNRAYKNCDAKTEGPQCGNKNNNSCPPYEESNKNKTCNISNDNMNKSAMPNLNCKRNDTVCSPRYYDSWDIDIGNYSEFLENCKSGRQDQSMQCRSSLNSTSNFQNVLSESFESTSSSDWSDETSKWGTPHSYNNSDSLSTLTTTGSSSDDDHQPNCSPIYPIRSDYRRDLTPDLNHFSGTRRLDGIHFDKRYNESASMDSEGYDFTNEGISCPFDNTQHLDSPNLNFHNKTRRHNINYNNTFSKSMGTVSEGHDFTDRRNSWLIDNAQQSDNTSNWPIPDQNYQDIEECNLPYSDWEHFTSDDEFSRNNIEYTNSPHGVYQQRRLEDWSFHELDIRNISMPELSYGTDFSDYNDSMDDDHNDYGNSCRRN